MCEIYIVSCAVHTGCDVTVVLCSSTIHTKPMNFEMGCEIIGNVVGRYSFPMTKNNHVDMYGLLFGYCLLKGKTLRHFHDSDPLLCYYYLQLRILQLPLHASHPALYVNCVYCNIILNWRNSIFFQGYSPYT